MQSFFEGATCRNAPDLEEAERETKMWKRGEDGYTSDLQVNLASFMFRAVMTVCEAAAFSLLARLAELLEYLVNCWSDLE
jgi:hypothetical protein